MSGSAFSASRARELRARHLHASGSAVRVLAVDDDEGVRRFVSHVLEDAGYVVTVAADGPDAIHIAAQARPFDMLLADLKMPQMAGDEMARILRYREPDLKVLYLTGYADQLFKEKPTLWDGEAFLEKPCTVAALLEAVSLLRYGYVWPEGDAREPFGLIRSLLKH
jgi:CheY-like chemotaxis protein